MSTFDHPIARVSVESVRRELIFARKPIISRLLPIFQCGAQDGEFNLASQLTNEIDTAIDFFPFSICLPV